MARGNLLEGNLYRTILRLSLPIMVNNFIQTLYNLVDSLWLGRVGSDELAAVSFVWPINSLFIAVGMGLSIAGISLMSQHLGADEREEANRYATQLTAVAVLSGVVFGLIGSALSEPFVRLMGAQGDMMEYSAAYLHIQFLDTPFMFFYYIFNAIMNAQGNTLTPTLISGVSALMNMVLDPLFIFVFHMDVEGAALATVLSKVTMALAGAYVLWRNHGVISLDFHHFRFDKERISRCMKVALPPIIGQSGSSFGFIVLNSFIVSYGTATMAAFGMVNKIFDLVNQPFSSVAGSLTAIVGQNIGANNIQRAKEAFFKVSRIVLIGGSFVALFLFFFRYPLIDFFLPTKDEPETIRQALEFLQIMAWSAPLMGMFFTFQGLFQGSGHTKYSMAMEVGRLWGMRLPMILLFKTFTDIGSLGVWISMTSSNFLICVFAFLMYRYGKWQQPALHHKK